MTSGIESKWEERNLRSTNGATASPVLRKRGRRRRISGMRCIALQLVAAVATLFVFLAMNKFNLRQHSSHNVTPAEAAALRFGFTGKIDLISQSQEQLSSHMRYWENSQKISRPLGALLFSKPQQETFLTWEPDFSGFNNIRLQMEILVILAHVTGRTFVMPGHVQSNIDHLEGASQVEDFYDFEHMGDWMKVISMQQYLDVRGLSKNHSARSDTKALRSYLRDSKAHVNTEYPNWVAAGQVLALPSANDTRVQARQAPSLAEFATTQYASSPNRIINEFSKNQTAARTLHFITADELGYRLFGGHGFLFFPNLPWQKFYWAGLRDHMHFSPTIIQNASALVIAVAKAAGGPFNAVHYRSTDWALQYPDQATGPHILTDRLLQIFSNQLPLFVATEDVNRTLLKPLIDAFPKVMFLKEFTDVLPGLHGNMYGMMDQLICSVGMRFAGTFGSTFTGYIHRLRGYHAPALVPDKGVYFLNYPFDDAAFRDTVRNNRWWTNSVWWPQPDAERYRDENWSREFSFTWDMDRA